MRTDLEFGSLDGESDGLLLLRFEGTLCGRCGEPFGQVLDGELAGHAGGIGDDHRELMCLLVVRQFLAVVPVIPDDAVEVHIYRPCHGRLQTVAVEVLHVAHGEVHRTFVDLARLRLDIDHEVGQLVVPREGQFGELTTVTYRRTVALVRLCAEIVHQQRLHFVHRIAVGVLEDTLVIGCEHEFHHAG